MMGLELIVPRRRPGPGPGPGPRPEALSQAGSLGPPVERRSRDQSHPTHDARQSPGPGHWQPRAGTDQALETGFRV